MDVMDTLVQVIKRTENPELIALILAHPDVNADLIELSVDEQERSLLIIAIKKMGDHNTELALAKIRHRDAETINNVAEAARQTQLAEEANLKLVKSIKIIQYILEADANANVVDHTGTSALMLTVKIGHIDAVKLMLEHGANVIEPETHNDSVLIQAVERCNNNIVGVVTENTGDQIARALLVAGANPNIADDNGDTPLLLAAQNGCSEVMTMLLETGVADIDVQNYIDVQNNIGETALIAATTSPDPKSALVLLPHNPNVNITDNNGRTALFYSVYNFEWQMPIKSTDVLIGLLAIEGIEINILDNDNMNVYTYAHGNANEELQNEILTALRDAGIQETLTFGQIFGPERHETLQTELNSGGIKFNPELLEAYRIQTYKDLLGNNYEDILADNSDEARDAGLNGGITLEPLVIPVKTPGEHIYELGAIIDWLRKPGTKDPLTNQPLLIEQLVIDQVKRNEVLAWLESKKGPVEEPVVEPTAEPVVEPTAEPVVEPTAEPATESQSGGKRTRTRRRKRNNRKKKTKRRKLKHTRKRKRNQTRKTNKRRMVKTNKKSHKKHK